MQLSGALKGSQAVHAAAALFLLVLVAGVGAFTRRGSAAAPAATGVSVRLLNESKRMDEAALAAQPRGRFTAHYVPGRAELPWLDGRSLDGRTCRLAADPKMIALQAEALRAADGFRASPATAAGTLVQTGSVLSQMVFCPQHNASEHTGSAEGRCRVEPIEPLHAFGRHPYARVGCRLPLHRPKPLEQEADLFNIDHLILASRCPPNVTGAAGAADAAVPGGGDGGGRASDRGGAHGAKGGGAGTAAPKAAAVVHTGRNLLFDAGCSVYAAIPPRTRGKPRPKNRRAQQGAHEGNTLAASGRGPSMPLFAQMYRDRCIEFDGIWGWDAQLYNPTEWWQGVPLDVRPKLRFYNVPIASGTAADPLLTIAQVARPEDFVVLKLDIDHFGVENEVVEELRTNRRKTNASLLVDEFFFECAPASAVAVRSFHACPRHTHRRRVRCRFCAGTTSAHLTSRSCTSIGILGAAARWTTQSR